MTSDSMQETYLRNYLSKTSQDLNDRSFADVCLRIGVNEFRCHAFLLSAHSDDFKTALSTVWIKKRADGLAKLDLSQFEKETVEATIEFIYSGKIEFKGNGDIIKIAEAADYLLMPDLFELCLVGIGEFTSYVVPMFVLALKCVGVKVFWR
jgi:hypothetical protein